MTQADTRPSDVIRNSSLTLIALIVESHLGRPLSVAYKKIPKGRELRRGEAGGMRGLYKKQISVVGLKWNDQGWAA